MGGHSSEGWQEKSGRAGVQIMSYPESVNEDCAGCADALGYGGGNRAVQIWRTQGGAEGKGRNVLVCSFCS